MTPEAIAAAYNKAPQMTDDDIAQTRDSIAGADKATLQAALTKMGFVFSASDSRKKLSEEIMRWIISRNGSSKRVQRINRNPFDHSETEDFVKALQSLGGFERKLAKARATEERKKLGLPEPHSDHSETITIYSIDKAKGELFLDLIRTFQPGQFGVELNRLNKIALDNGLSKIVGHVTGLARLRLAKQYGFQDAGFVRQQGDEGVYRVEKLVVTNHSETKLGETEDWVETFESGTHRGKEYSPDDVAEIARNFQVLSRPVDKAILKVPAVIGHDEDQTWVNDSGYPAAGWASDCKTEDVVGEDGQMQKKLLNKIKDIPEELGKLINQHTYRTVSAEIYDDFVGPDDKHYGKTLRRIAFLGGEIPQVKTLADLPKVGYREEGGKFMAFGDKMDKLGENDIEIGPKSTGAFKREVEARGGKVTSWRDKGIGTLATQLATVDGLDSDDLDELQKKYSVNKFVSAEYRVVSDTPGVFIIVAAKRGDKTPDHLKGKQFKSKEEAERWAKDQGYPLAKMTEVTDDKETDAAKMASTDSFRKNPNRVINIKGKKFTIVGVLDDDYVIGKDEKGAQWEINVSGDGPYPWHVEGRYRYSEHAEVTDDKESMCKKLREMGFDEKVLESMDDTVMKEVLRIQSDGGNPVDPDKVVEEDEIPKVEEEDELPKVEEEDEDEHDMKEYQELAKKHKEKASKFSRQYAESDDEEKKKDYAEKARKHREIAKKFEELGRPSPDREEPSETPAIAHMERAVRKMVKPLVTKLSELECKETRRDRRARTQEVERFCERLVAAGKLLPAEKESTLFTLSRLDDSKVFKFSEKESCTDLQRAMNLLEKRPQIVKFGERFKDPHKHSELAAQEFDAFWERHGDELGAHGEKKEDWLDQYKKATPEERKKLIAV